MIAFARTKGGVGKSVLACQIKEAGRDGITAIQLSGKTVHKDLKQLAAPPESDMWVIERCAGPLHLKWPRARIRAGFGDEFEHGRG